jgi:hypothetical protein
MRYFQASPPKLAKARFQKECLTEYAQTFKTVCLDAGCYPTGSDARVMVGGSHNRSDPGMNWPENTFTFVISSSLPGGGSKRS